MQQAPIQASPAKIYRQNRYRSIDQSWVNRREQHLMENILTSYHLEGRKVLDSPCGYGRFFPIYKRLGMVTTGLDLSLDMAQLSDCDTASCDQKEVLHGNIMQLPFAAEAFDIAICIRLLHHQFHAVEQYQLFAELARVSRRYVLVSYYCFDWLHAGSCIWRWRRKGRLPAILSERDLKRLAEASDLHTLSTHTLLRYGHMQTFAMLGKNSA